MNGLEKLRQLRNSLPAGEEKPEPRKPKSDRRREAEEEQALKDWTEQFGSVSGVNKNGINKFAGGQKNVADKQKTKIAQGQVAGIAKNNIGKTDASDEELLRMMLGEIQSN